MRNSNGFRVVGECGVELEPMALYELREMLALRGPASGALTKAAPALDTPALPLGGFAGALLVPVGLVIRRRILLAEQSSLPAVPALGLGTRREWLQKAKTALHSWLTGLLSVVRSKP